MGAGKAYTQEEILAIARIKIQNPGVQLGPAFWDTMLREGRLPPCLRDRMVHSGGDLAKWMNHNREKVMMAVEELILENPGRGRNHKHTHTSDQTLVYFAVNIKKGELPGVQELLDDPDDQEEPEEDDQEEEEKEEEEEESLHLYLSSDTSDTSVNTVDLAVMLL